MEKLETGVPGLDTVLNGGVPKGSLVLVGGPPGAGKTILTTQMAFHHATTGKRVLMLAALSEANAKLIAYLNGLDFFDAGLIGNQISILNIQKMLTDEGLDATLAEIRSTVLEHRIELLIIDSLRSLYTLTENEKAVQSFVFGLGSALFMVGCTTLLVEDQYTRTSTTTSPEQSISDTILMLEVSSIGRRVIRKVEVVKMRGAHPLEGAHSFEITTSGISVYPRIESLPLEEPDAPSNGGRLSWGVRGLDELTGGGIPAGSSTVLFGTAGIGKTTVALEFVTEGHSNGESCLYVSFHETERELLEKAARFGKHPAEAPSPATLRVIAVSPGEMNTDQVLARILADIDDRPVSRLVIDTINALERDAAREGRFTDVVAALARVIRARGVTLLLLRETTQFVGQALELADGREVYWTPIHNLVLMHPVEIGGSLDRVLAVLKMRNSVHDHTFSRFNITEAGIEITGAFEGMQGLLTGLPRKTG